MKLCKKDLCKVISLSVCLITAVSICLFVNKYNNPKPTFKSGVENVSLSKFKKVISQKDDTFVIMGESTNSLTVSLIDNLLREQKKNLIELYYFDTSGYTQPILSEDDEIKRTDLILEYNNFMDENQIENLPTIIHYKDGTVVASYGSYIEDGYYEEKDEKKKTNLLNQSNNRLNTWMLKEK